MFSATLRQETVDACRDLLDKPVVYRPLTSALVVSRTVEHHFHPMGAKNDEFVDIVLEDLLSTLVPIDSAVRSWGSIIVFMEKTKQAQYVMIFFVFSSLHLTSRTKQASYVMIFFVFFSLHLTSCCLASIFHLSQVCG